MMGWRWSQETYEEYFKAVSEQAVEEVLASPRDEEEDDAFRIPRLGQHWSEAKSIDTLDDGFWENEEDDEPSISLNPRAQGRRRGGLSCPIPFPAPRARATCVAPIYTLHTSPLRPAETH